VFSVQCVVAMFQTKATSEDSAALSEHILRQSADRAA